MAAFNYIKSKEILAGGFGRQNVSLNLMRLCPGLPSHPLLSSLAQLPTVQFLLSLHSLHCIGHQLKLEVDLRRQAILPVQNTLLPQRKSEREGHATIPIEIPPKIPENDTYYEDWERVSVVGVQSTLLRAEDGIICTKDNFAMFLFWFSFLLGLPISLNDVIS